MQLRTGPWHSLTPHCKPSHTDLVKSDPLDKSGTQDDDKSKTCRKSNGNGWRCRNAPLAGKSLCPKHYSNTFQRADTDKDQDWSSRASYGGPASTKRGKMHSMCKVRSAIAMQKRNTYKTTMVGHGRSRGSHSTRIGPWFVTLRAAKLGYKR